MRYVTLFLLFFSYLCADKLLLTDFYQTYLATKGNITMCVHSDRELFEKIILIHDKALPIGISADIIALIAKRLELIIELVPTKSWEESLQFSKEKRCDILSFENKTPKTEQWLMFTEPIFHHSYTVQIGVLKDDTILKDILNIGIAGLSQKDIDIIFEQNTQVVNNKINYITIGVFIFLGMLLCMLIIFWYFKGSKIFR